MIRISDKSLCCGCTACVAVCPAQCIVFRRDREGFDYPVANPDLCIHCGKCESVCPVLNPLEPDGPMASYAVRIPEFVEGSSSGGVFPALARNVIAAGGVVYGAVFNPDMTVGHMAAETMSEVGRMRGSKYVQSDLYDSFGEIKEYLKQGRPVLFSGTPCQVAGLNRFLGKKHDSLLTVELACHGVPSPGVWEKYLDALSLKYGGMVSEVNFRDKSRSWRNYDFTVSIGDTRVSVPHHEDPFMALFLQNMTLRPSCYECPSKGGRSHADIILADLWNMVSVPDIQDDDKGMSLAVANTLNGKVALQALNVEFIDVDLVSARQKNSGFENSARCPEHRSEFFSGLHSAKDMIAYLSGFVMKKNLRMMLSNLKRRIIK